jgi:hypothetical protein
MVGLNVDFSNSVSPSLFLAFSLSCSLFVLSLSLSFFGYLLNGAGIPA